MVNNNDEINLAQIRSRIEEEDLNWRAEETFLSRLPAEERRQYLGLIVTENELEEFRAETRQKAEEEQAEFRAAEAFGAPTAKDWRNVGGQNYVTDVKNQGPCGSCVSFGTCATIESNIRIKAKSPTLAIDLSEAFLQFCGGGSCGGWGLTSGLAYAKSDGVTDEACFPYKPQNLPCGDRCSDWASRLTQIVDYSGHATMEARKTAIAEIGPVTAGMAVYSDFYSYSSGVYVKTAGSSLEGYHCVCVVGYDDNQQCWIVKNSWGPGWGDGGFVRIRYGQADLHIDSDMQFYSVEVDVEPISGSGFAEHLLIDERFGSTSLLWAYVDGKWRHKVVAKADLAGIAQVLFAADRVYVWWKENEIQQVRPWQSP